MTMKDRAGLTRSAKLGSPLDEAEYDLRYWERALTMARDRAAAAQEDVKFYEAECALARQKWDELFQTSIIEARPVDG